MRAHAAAAPPGEALPAAVTGGPGRHRQRRVTGYATGPPAPVRGSIAAFPPAAPPGRRGGCGRPPARCWQRPCWQACPERWTGSPGRRWPTSGLQADPLSGGTVIAALAGVAWLLWASSRPRWSPRSPRGPAAGPSRGCPRSPPYRRWPRRRRVGVPRRGQEGVGRGLDRAGISFAQRHDFPVIARPQQMHRITCPSRAPGGGPPPVWSLAGARVVPDNRPLSDRSVGWSLLPDPQQHLAAHRRRVHATRETRTDSSEGLDRQLSLLVVSVCQVCEIPGCLGGSEVRWLMSR